MGRGGARLGLALPPARPPRHLTRHRAPNHHLGPLDERGPEPGDGGVVDDTKIRSLIMGSLEGFQLVLVSTNLSDAGLGVPQFGPLIVGSTLS